MTPEEEFEWFGVGESADLSAIFSSSDSKSTPPTSPPRSASAESENELSAEATRWKRLYESLCEKVDTLTKERDEALEEIEKLKLQIAMFKDIEYYESDEERGPSGASEGYENGGPISKGYRAVETIQKSEQSPSTQAGKKKELQRPFKRPSPRSYAHPPKEVNGLVSTSATTKTVGQKRKHEDDEESDEPASKRAAHLGQNSFSRFGNLWSKPPTFSPFVGSKALGPGRATGTLPSEQPQKPFEGGQTAPTKKAVSGSPSPLSMAGAAPGWATAASSLRTDPSNRFGAIEVTTTFSRDPYAAKLTAVSESQSPRDGRGRTEHSKKSAPEEPAAAAEQHSESATTSEPTTSRPVFGKPSPFQESQKPSNGITGGGFSVYSQGSGFASKGDASSAFGTDAALLPAKGSSAFISELDSSNGQPPSEAPALPRPVNGLAYVAACRAWLQDAKDRIEDKTLVDLFPPHPMHDCKRLDRSPTAWP
ncbi:hypothetical protein HII31_05890 [Pseudocercospora fuligena]|uniref:Uncharacterized protein n=1 Tax=Pseudocercospora fuligena TaxID=685502 RepID=A0A8H6RKN7_9PEZI|nr:hypothetical protein HII31_05890 [Pseudocercospora fuligena]